MTTTAEETPALKLRSGYEYSNEGRDPSHPHPGWTEKDVNEEVQKKLLGALKEAREKTTQTEAKNDGLWKVATNPCIPARMKFEYAGFRLVIFLVSFVAWGFRGVFPKISTVTFLLNVVLGRIQPPVVVFVVMLSELLFRIFFLDVGGTATRAQNAVVSQDTVRKYDGL